MTLFSSEYLEKLPATIRDFYSNNLFQRYTGSIISIEPLSGLQLIFNNADALAYCTDILDEAFENNEYIGNDFSLDNLHILAICRVPENTLEDTFEVSEHTSLLFADTSKQKCSVYFYDSGTISPVSSTFIKFISLLSEQEKTHQKLSKKMISIACKKYNELFDAKLSEAEFSDFIIDEEDDRDELFESLCDDLGFDYFSLGVEDVFEEGATMAQYLKFLAPYWSAEINNS